VKQQSEHLSNAQIEQYGKRASGAGPETEAWVETHLDDCPSCRSRVLDFQRTRFALLPDPKVITVSSSNCPSEEDLRNLAAGLSAEPIANKLKAHASNCERCGPLLQEYIEDFSDESSPEEQAFLSQLRTASPEYREQKAREMLQREMFKKNRVTPAPVPSTDWRSFFSWKWILIPATAVIALAAITFPVYLARRDTPEKVEVLLAQASTERRNLEMRIPFEKYSEFHQKRSGEPTPLLQLPESSRKAADAISSHLKAHPDDPEWLLLSARWYLLDWQFKPALEALEKIENKDPARQSEIDMVRAMALYEKAAYDPSEYGRAINLLGTVLQKNPNDPIALHNQAVACEKVQNYECAIEDWNRLLKIEKDPDWSSEAQKRLNQVQEKKNPASTPSPK
jgi:cytochrome c-type biogenesis protein CcmH/NrfG